MKISPTTLIVTAYAKAPQSTVMYEQHKYMGIILEIEKQSSIIVNVEVTVLTEIVKNYLKRMIVGYDFSKDISPLIETIEENYFAPSQNSLIVSLKVAHQRYQDIRKNPNNE